jgi:mRNA interferase MazF
VSHAARGEIWLVDFGEPMGHEQGYRWPAVVVSSNRMNASRAGLVIVVPITSRKRGLPSHVEIDADNTTGLRRIGHVSPEALPKLERVITPVLEL